MFSALANIEVNELKINKMSEETLSSMEKAGTIGANQIYVTVDDETSPRGLPLGTIIPVSLVSDDSSLHLADGSSLSQTGIYSQFCTWLKERVAESSSNVPTCTIDEYARDMDIYGQCAKYVINNGAEKDNHTYRREGTCIRYQGYRLNSSGGLTSYSGSSVVFIPVYAYETILFARNNAPLYNYIYETSNYGTSFTKVKDVENPSFSTVQTYTVKSGNAKYVAITVTDTDYNGIFQVVNGNTKQTVSANSVKLPTITEFVASSNGDGSIGLAEFDTFKSHNHAQDAHMHGVQTFPYGGSNSSYYVVSPTPGGNVDSSISWQGGYTDTRTPAIHNTGDEETRPKNVRYPYYIVVAM